MFHSSVGNCRYQYTEQPVPLISCNPYANSRLATSCTVTLASNEQRINVLTWIFVSEAGSGNRLSSETSRGKYTITQTNVGLSIKSLLNVNSLQESDEGSYYCQAEFSNGTALSRSQEINIFDRRAYTNFPSCNESRVESTVTSRCVLFTSEVVQPLPSTEAPSAASVTTVTGNGNGTQSEPAVTDQSAGEGEGEEEGGNELSIANVLLYSAIGAVVFLVLVITLLVVCICLCSKGCDCCSYTCS